MVPAQAVKLRHGKAAHNSTTMRAHLPAVDLVQQQHRVRHKLVAGAVGGVEVEVGACT